MTENIIFSAENICGKNKGFTGKNKFFLNGVNFGLPEGYIMGVVGKNGAGKSTFFDYIMNNRKKYTGRFMLNGCDIHENHSDVLDSIGYISDSCSYFKNMTAGENAELLGGFYSRFDRSVFEDIMKQGGLSESVKVSTFSRGEFIRFQLAFVMAHSPSLILLDEPTAGMDPVFRKEFFRILRRYLEKGGSSVIMSSHIEDDIDKQFDYIGRFENGVFTEFRENESA